MDMQRYFQLHNKTLSFEWYIFHFDYPNRFEMSKKRFKIDVKLNVEIWMKIWKYENMFSGKPRMLNGLTTDSMANNVPIQNYTRKHDIKCLHNYGKSHCNFRCDR